MKLELCDGIVGSQHGTCAVCHIMQWDNDGHFTDRLGDIVCKNCVIAVALAGEMPPP